MQKKQKTEYAGTYSVQRTIRGIPTSQEAGTHPVPILTHYPRRRKRVRLIWTPLNVALLILLAAALSYILTRTLTMDPLSSSDLMISMADSVYRI